METIPLDLSAKKGNPGSGVYKVFKPISEATSEVVELALAEKTDQARSRD